MRWPTIGVALGLPVLLATRLPQLTGGRAVLDGDESILGLMARHWLERGRPEVFFYGQDFGIALFESAPVALAFALFGTSAVAAKAAVLGLWVVGWALCVAAVRRLAGPGAACVTAWLLLSAPAWGRWSTMPRGYHVAGFVLAQLCLFLLAGLRERDRARLVGFAALGATMALLLLTQAIWFLALLPFLGLVDRRAWTPARGAVWAAALVGVAGAVHLSTRATASDFWSPAFLYGADPAAAALLLPQRLWVYLGGAYLYGRPFEIAGATAWATAAWSALGLGVPALLVVPRLRFAARDPRWCCLASAVAVIGLTLFVNERRFGFRYLLPLAGVLAVWAGVEATRWIAGPASRRRLAVGTVALVVLLGLAAIVEVPRRSGDRSTDGRALAALVDELLSREIHHVYCLHPTLQWQILFASEERILARWVDPADRRPEIPRAVDAALFAGRPVAVVGPAAQQDQLVAFLAGSGPGAGQVRSVGGRYFFLPGASEDLVRRLGFGLNDPERSR